MGIGSTLLYPLLDDVGIISYKKDKVVVNLNYCNNIFKLQHNELHPDNDIHFSHTYAGNPKKRRYYLCIGVPHYNNITHQVNDKEFEYPAALRTRRTFSFRDILEKKYDKDNDVIDLVG